MEGVVALCPRVIAVDRSRLVHDGDLRQLVKQMHSDKRVSFTAPEHVPDGEFARLGGVLAREGSRITLRVGERELPTVVGHLLGAMRAADLAVEDPPLEEVMRELFGRTRDAEAS